MVVSGLNRSMAGLFGHTPRRGSMRMLNHLATKPDLSCVTIMTAQNSKVNSIGLKSKLISQIGKSHWLIQTSHGIHWKAHYADVIMTIVFMFLLQYVVVVVIIVILEIAAAIVGFVLKDNIVSHNN